MGCCGSNASVSVKICAFLCHVVAVVLFLWCGRPDLPGEDCSYGGLSESGSGAKKQTSP